MKKLIFASLFTAAITAAATADEARILGMHLVPDGWSVEKIAAEIVKANPDFVTIVGPKNMWNDQARLEELTGLHSAYQVGARSGIFILSAEKPRELKFEEFGQDGGNFSAFDIASNGTKSFVYLRAYNDCFVGTTDGERNQALKLVSAMKLDRPLIFPEDGFQTREVSRGAANEINVIPLPKQIAMKSGIFETGIREDGDFLSLATVTRDAALPSEGYAISVTAKSVAVRYADEAGKRHAARTLGQLALPRWGRMVLPCCEIEDAPRFPIRVLHLDEARHFFGQAAVKRVLDLMAEFKYNVLHWHLTDNQGWRFPVKGYPQFADAGAKRPYVGITPGLVDHNESGTYGPFIYTEEEIKTILAYAAERGIRVMPEIDVPGHCNAFLKAFPECRCDWSAQPSMAGFRKEEVCPGNDRTLEILKVVVDEVVRIFPDAWVHLGGDEVQVKNWKKCPRCQARMRKENLKDERELQCWFVRQLAEYVEQKGKRWCEWETGVKYTKSIPNAIHFGAASAHRELLARGESLVVNDSQHVYFLYNQGIRDDYAPYERPRYSVPLTLKSAYTLDPMKGVPSEYAHLILGGLVCNWTETVPSESELQWTLWPRACASAECLWSPKETRNYDDFVRRMTVQRRRLRQRGINCAPLE